MTYRLLRRGPALAGLLGACLVTACASSEDSGQTCKGDDCSAEGEGPSEAAAKPSTSKPSTSKPSTSKPSTSKPSTSKPSTSTGSGSGSDTSTGHGASASSGLPCDVAAIVSKSCGTCHGATPAFGAPNALASAADFQADHDGEKMYAHVRERINESDPRKAMPPASSAPLSAADKATLNAWLSQGAPASTESCGGGHTGGGTTPDKPVDTTGLQCYRLTAHNGDGKTPYKVGVAKDAYFNFTFKAPWQGMVYGILARPVIDNPQAIHHWLLFQDSANNQPTGAVRSVGAHPGGTLLAGWAPGGTPFNLQGLDAGLELPGNRSYTIEYHYNSTDANASDASGVEICVQTKKPSNIAALAWLGYDNLGAKSTKWTGTCRPAQKKRVHIVEVVPHMHKTGIHMKATINRANGKKEILHDQAFDFNYQIGYPKDVWIEPGDTVTTECTFSQPMKFGESTNAEMCYLFTLSYPKGGLEDNGPWGRLAHGTGSCLGQ